MTDENLPAPPSDGDLPSFSDWLAQWLGFQLPSVPMPQTIKNLDKAVGKILLAAGENAEARIKANTGKQKAQGKIAIDGMYRTEEERRKLENRAAVVKVAVDELNEEPPKQDAAQEIDDDWLNLFAKLSEDKTSEELRSLFGKILAGEIRKPGSFSLRTMQFVATLSRAEAHKISEFFAFALDGEYIVLPDDLNTEEQPGLSARRFVEDLGIASAPNQIGGLEMNASIDPNGQLFFRGSGFAVVIANNSSARIEVCRGCQVLTDLGKELYSIANPPKTPIEYLRKEVDRIAEIIPGARSHDGLIKVSLLELLERQADGSYSARTVYEPTREAPPEQIEPQATATIPPAASK